MNRSSLTLMRKNPPTRPRGRYLARWMIFLLLLTAIPVPAPAAQAAPDARPTLQAADATPQFLRDIPDLVGLMDDISWWTVGGGFLYWSHCSADIGYLRRWPLGGGSVATLKDGPFCGVRLSADATGLYYWENGYIMQRPASDPFNARVLLASPSLQSDIVLDTGYWADYIFWLANSTIYSANKRGFEPVGQPEPAGANARSLMFASDKVYWFGDGQLYSALTYCLSVGGGSCAKTTVAAETGDDLIKATLSRLSRSASTFPLWLSGPNIRGVRCIGIGGSCAPASVYTAPIINGVQYETSHLATDGHFLYWIDDYWTCGLRCRWGDDGRLMKWSLEESLGGPGPFDNPQPIAFQNSGGASYGINDTQIAVTDGWVYFGTSNGISRIRADAPPIAWDLAFSGWEVTQGIQSLNNDVPLVANKPTFVRLYGNKLSGPNIFGVDARLYGTTAGGTPLPGSPLRPVNGTQSFTANNTGPNRSAQNGGWLFQLPDEWTNAGTISLNPLIDPRRVWSDPNRANNTVAARSFSFTRKAPICIITIPVRTHAPAASNSDPSLYLMIDTLKRLMPTSDVWLFHQDNDVAQIEARFGIPPWKYEPYAIPDDKDKVLNALGLRGDLTDDPDACDDIGAITHYVGLVHAQTPTNQGGGENLGFGRTPGDALYVKLINPALFGAVDWQTQRFNTLAHELSHNYGRKHVNCGGPANPDPGYPYPDGSGTNCWLDSGALTAPGTHFGFHTTNLTPIVPNTTMDYMAYGAPYWVSDYTWKAIFGILSNTAGQARAIQSAQSELAAAGAVVYISGSVTPGQSQGQLDYAWTFPSTTLSQGILRKLQRSAAPRFGAAPAAQPSANAYHLRLLDSRNAVLDDRAVTLTKTEDADGPTRGFALSFPAPSGQVARIELLNGGTLIANLQPGAQAPTVSVTSPAGGETFDDQMTLSWRASDPNSGDKLLFTVQYSPDNGQTWRALLTNFPNLSGSNTVTVDLKSISGLPASSAGGIIRVAASDGYNTSFATSQPFKVPNRAPQPTIISPGPGQSLPAGQTVLLQGAASDAEDGGLSGASLSWALDGEPLGTGQEQAIAGLAPGSYTVTLTARDSAGREQTASTTLTIEALHIPLGSAPTLDGECSDDAYATATQVQIAPYEDGVQPTVQFLRTAGQLWACFSNMARAGGTSPGSVAVLRVDANYSRDTQLQPGDYVFVLGEDGVLTTYDAFTTPGPAGAAQVSANQATWQAELRINASVLGGWNRVIGLDVEHAWVNAVADDYYWPYGASWDNPSSWATTVLGEVPRVRRPRSGRSPSRRRGLYADHRRRELPPRRHGALERRR